MKKYQKPRCIVINLDGHEQMLASSSVSGQSQFRMMMDYRSNLIQL